MLELNQAKIPEVSGSTRSDLDLHQICVSFRTCYCLDVFDLF